MNNDLFIYQEKIKNIDQNIKLNDIMTCAGIIEYSASILE